MLLTIATLPPMNFKAAIASITGVSSELVTVELTNDSLFVILNKYPLWVKHIQTIQVIKSRIIPND